MLIDLAPGVSLHISVLGISQCDGCHLPQCENYSPNPGILLFFSSILCGETDVAVSRGDVFSQGFHRRGHWRIPVAIHASVYKTQHHIFEIRDRDVHKDADLSDGERDLCDIKICLAQLH